MPEQPMDLLSSFLTDDQIRAIAKLKDSLRPEEVEELRSAGERLLKNVKTEKDLANLIESAAKSGSMPDIKSPRLRKIVGGMASKVSASRSETEPGKSSTKGRSAPRKPASSTHGARRRSVRKKT